MNADAAKDAMLGVFKAKWDTLGSPAGSYPATYTDVPAAKPGSETVWARAIVRHTLGRQASLASDTGTRRFENTGFVWIQVFGPIGDGSSAALVASQAIVDAYRDAKTSVLFRDVTLEEKGGDGAFERVDVKAYFEYDDVR